MAPKLFISPTSPPARAVRMTAKHINLELELKVIKTAEGEQKSPEFVKINPQHTVPTLIDNGFILWDSHAIMTYLVEKYGKGDSLYPNDLEKRAVIHQRLFFDSGVLFARFAPLAGPMVREGKPLKKESLEPLTEAYDFLEAFLQDKDYMAGNTLTVADFSIVSTLSTIDVVLPVDDKKWPKLASWFNKMQTVPAYEENKEGLRNFAAIANKLCV